MSGIFPKPPDWCDKEGVQHSWREKSRLELQRIDIVEMPMGTLAIRVCVNCGHRQALKPETWEDIK